MQKNIKIILPVIFVVTALFSSCHKKKDDPTPAGSSNNNNNNNNVSTSTTGSYLPLTKGNVWNYTTVSNPAGDYTYSSTVPGGTKVFNGKTYSVLIDVLSTDPTTSDSTYAYQDGNKYYSYAPQTPTGGGALELKLIDLDLPIGTSWSTSYPANQYTNDTYTFKVTATGLTRTVNNINYTDVISVDLTTTVALSSSYIALLESSGLDASDIALVEAEYGGGTSITQTTYYAKNVGVIEQTSSTGGLAIQLVSSTIK
jgi:hypothetical protein